MKRYLLPLFALVGAMSISPQAHAEEITGYMPCKQFMTLLSEESIRANQDHSPESNKILERHVAEMMAMLQPYAIVDNKGVVLQYTWAFLVSKTGEFCTAHPEDRLDDAIKYAGQKIFEAYKYAKSSLEDRSANHVPAPPPSLGDLEPPSGIPQ